MKQLTATVVNLGKTRSGQKSRSGYKDEKNLIYLPPISEKRKMHWIVQMKEKGFIFNG